jgi:hypothetical protein
MSSCLLEVEEAAPVVDGAVDQLTASASFSLGVAVVSGILHGDGVAASGAGFIARGRQRAVWGHAARRGRERAPAAALRAWRPRGTSSRRVQSALGSRAEPAPPAAGR